MRVCSYNIHGGTDEACAPSLPEIAETLRQSGADIALLQECDRFLLRSGMVHQPRALARLLGENVTCRFYGPLKFGPFAFGNAVLSRVPVTKTFHVKLWASGGEPRGALGIRTSGGLTVWNTHLGLRDDWRETQLAALADAIRAEGGGAPVIVGGDFNARLDAPEVQNFLAQTGLQVLSGDAPTFPASVPASRIDFLFGRGVTVIETGIICAKGSDHCLIWADVQT